MKDKQTKYPQLRFNGFTDPWEQRKTKELCDISTGKGNTQDKVKDGKYPFYVRSATIERSNEYLYDQEAVLTVGDGVGTGKVFHYVNGKYNLHQRVYRMFNFNHGVSAKYFYHYFSKNFYRRVMSMTAKTSVDSVRMEMIADMKIKFPSPAEQETIVAVLDGVDDLISLHQRKLAKLKKLKQGYLQKMFPQNGSKFPQLRFSGFADAWEERKLSTESTITAGGDIDKSKLKEVGEYPIFANALTNDGIVGYYDSSYRVEAPAVTVTGRGDVGNAKARKVNFTPVVRLLAVKSNHDVDFLENAINNHKVLVESTGVPQLTAPQLGNYKIFFPTGEEQQKIGSFFKQIDDTIALHQRKLEKLQELKKGYLQKMFC
ncbi:restriction endonuclease subunit S [Companilactobacillus alimentarius]|uniref:restriction endonuclease subunit S n=1 Tax=Companilactobacillus alimentarius TaxID=1602 RepID=UPI003D7CA48B